MAAITRTTFRTGELTPGLTIYTFYISKVQ
jgi:hypothetical protein